MNCTYPRKLVTPPAEEPLTLAEAKLHCQVDHNEEDSQIAAHVIAARTHVEQITGIPLVTQVWDIYPSCFPYGYGDDGHLHLPFGNLQSVDEFEWTGANSITSEWTVSGSNLIDGSIVRAHVDTIADPARIVLADSQLWPSGTWKSNNPIRVRITVGYGDRSAVPEPFKSAMRLLIRHWYDNRSAVVVGNQAAAVSEDLQRGVDSLLVNYRLWSF